MSDESDLLEKLLLDVRRTIFDNKQFIEKLVDETTDDDSEDEAETPLIEDEFEEL